MGKQRKQVLAEAASVYTINTEDPHSQRQKYGVQARRFPLVRSMLWRNCRERRPSA